MKLEEGSLSVPATGSHGLQVPDYVAFDLETTGLSPDDDEILEVAFVRFSDGQPVERWSTLLNPLRHIPLKALRLTNIDPHEIKESPVFGDVSEHIARMSGGLPLVGHNSSFDTAFLAKRIEGFPGVTVYDTLELSRIVIPGFQSYKLVELAQFLGVPLTDAHRAYDDAEVSGRIFALLQERILRMGRRLRETVASIMGDSWEARRLFLFEPAGQAIRPLFDEPSPERVRAGRQTGAGSSGGQDLPEEFEQGFPDGTGQLFNRIVEVLSSPAPGPGALSVPLVVGAAHAVVEAAWDFTRRTGGRVLLAGFPQGFLPGGIHRAPVPQDYLCLRRFLYAKALACEGLLREVGVEERRFLASLSVWAEQTDTGSFAEVQVAGTAAHGVVGELGCPKSMECRSSCPFKAECRYLLAERMAGGSPVQFARLDRVLVMSGEFDRVVVWGAHDLHKVWQYGEDRVDLALILDAVRSENALGQVPALERLYAVASKGRLGGIACAEAKKWAAETGAQLAGAARWLRERLQETYGFLQPDDARGVSWTDPPIVSAHLHRMERASEVLASFSSASGDHLALVEASYGDERRGPFLVRRSIWPARDAVRTIETRLGTPVLLSDVASQAGATQGGHRLFLGVDSPVVDLRDGPGDGATVHDLLVACADVKAPSAGPGFAEYAFSFTRDLALRVRKGLLVLFPSRAQIKDVYGLLAPELEKEGIVVYAQGLDGGRRVLEHLEEEDSVVLALAGSPGDDEPVPTCLAVMKVPFPPPNPVDDARRKELSRAGADPFVEVSVRAPSLMIRRYAARMLDSGGKRALVLADPRLSPGESKWAGEFFRALDDLTRESGPPGYVFDRVKEHLSGNP
ncbi:MAG: exonuclease domain-containing protein [Bacillota bacterium]|nr:hypothetical protein [Candidatus Fermentithermobacillaceae bacterium]